MEQHKLPVPDIEHEDVRDTNSRVADIASWPPQPLPLMSDESTSQNMSHQDSQQTQTKHSLKNMVNPDSLYRYINWENPARTVASYMGVVSLLIGTHYLPLTQTALKIGATGLGLIATVEYVHRSFSSNTILARLRPSEYRKIPEPVLNDTLKDIHDLLQYLVVEAQKILLGQDLKKTFAGFAGMSALYWLVKILSPFALVLLSVTMVYLWPLIQSRQGREVMEDARLAAVDLSNTALKKSQDAANEGRVKAAQLSSKAQDTAVGAKQRLGELAQSGSQSAADFSNQVKDRLSDIASGTADNLKSVPQIGKNAMNQASQTANSALGSANEQVRSVLPESVREELPASAKTDVSSRETSGYSESNRDLMSGNIKRNVKDSQSYATAAKPMHDGSSTIITGSMTEHTSATKDAGEGHYELKGTASGMKDMTQSTPRHVAGTNASMLTDNMPNARSDGAQVGTHDIMDRPRAVPVANAFDTARFGKQSDAM